MSEAPDPERINEIFNDALELPLDQRERFIQSACENDSRLRTEVLSLLAKQSQARQWMPDLTQTISLAPAFRNGDLICNRYLVLRLLGRGGMGEVYEAEDREMGDLVALKSIRPEIASGEGILARFRQEIQLGRKIAHPNACHIYNIDKHESTYFFSMELLRGDTLAARLKSIGRFTSAAALPLIEQMAGALSAAHDAGIIHRDFKPGNVMLCEGDPRRRAVITDFGLARLVQPAVGGSTTGLTHFAGTPAYMAPEQLEEGSLSPATDIYALGLVAYEMITGKRPFEGTSDISAAVRRMTGNPTPLANYVPDVEPHWNAAILRCLERDPTERWPAATDFTRALTNLPAEQPTSARTAEINPPTRPGAEPVPKPKRAVALGKRWWILIASVAALAALGVWRFIPSVAPRPAEAQEWLDKGIAAVRDGVYWKAATSLDRAISIDRNMPIAYARRAEAWNEMDSPDKAASDMAVANAHRSQARSLERQYVDAINSTVAREFGDAVNKYRAVLDSLPSGEKHFAHVDLGRAYEKNAEPFKAIDEYRLATVDGANRPGCWLRLGVLEAKLQRIDAARQDLQTALNLFRAGGDSEGRAQATFEMARISTPKEAEKLLTDALSLAGENVYQQIVIELQQSHVAAAQNQFEQAKILAAKAQTVAADNGMPVLGARSLNDTAVALANFGRRDEALAYFRKAYAMSARLHAERQEYGALLNLGGLLLTTAPEEGRRDLEISRAWLFAHGYAKETASADILIARAQRDSGSYQQALATLENASKETADPQTESSVLRDLANVYFNVENYPAAAQTVRKAREIDERIGNTRLLGPDDEQLGSALAYAGDIKGATDLFAQALKEGVPALVIGIDNAQAALLGGKPKVALELSRKALVDITDSDDRIDAQRIACMALARAGKPAAGQVFCDQAVAAASRSDQNRSAAARLSLAFVGVQSGDGKKALEITSTLCPELERNHQRDSLWRCLLYQAQASKALAGPDSARAAAKKSRAVLDALSAEQGHDWSGPYRSRADLASDFLALQGLEQ